MGNKYYNKLLVDLKDSTRPASANTIWKGTRKNYRLAVACSECLFTIQPPGQRGDPIWYSKTLPRKVNIWNLCPSKDRHPDHPPAEFDHIKLYLNEAEERDEKDFWTEVSEFPMEFTYADGIKPDSKWPDDFTAEQRQPRRVLPGVTPRIYNNSSPNIHRLAAVCVECRLALKYWYAKTLPRRVTLPICQRHKGNAHTGLWKAYSYQELTQTKFGHDNYPEYINWPTGQPAFLPINSVPIQLIDRTNQQKPNHTKQFKRFSRTMVNIDEKILKQAQELIRVPQTAGIHGPDRKPAGIPTRSP